MHGGGHHPMRLHLEGCALPRALFSLYNKPVAACSRPRAHLRMAAASAAAANAPAAQQADAGGVVFKPMALVQPERYEEQLQIKLQKLKQLFASHQLVLPELEIHRSEPSHYRCVGA